MPDSSVQNDFKLIDAYWRASNYLTIGQIYLLDNPLLREPLRADHIVLLARPRARAKSSARYSNRRSCALRRIVCGGAGG